MTLASEFASDLAGLHPHLPVSAVVYGVNISLRHKYIFVETPKCACTTIKLALQRLELADARFTRSDPEDIHVREFSPLLNPRQVPSFRNLLADESFFKFCFVRNPFTRLLSSYLDKFQRNRPQKIEILRQLGLPDHRLDTPVSFEQFVKAVVEQPVALMDAHWRVQYYQTMQSGITYDFIGRFERFAEDMRVAGGRIAQDFGSYLGAEIYNGTDAASAAEHYLTKDIKTEIRRKYQIDFEHFGYEAE